MSVHCDAETVEVVKVAVGVVAVAVVGVATDGPVDAGAGAGAGVDDANVGAETAVVVIGADVATEDRTVGITATFDEAVDIATCAVVAVD